MVILNKGLRRRILEVGRDKKMGHYGSSMSCLDTIKYLYDNVLAEQDVFILSKGHGAPALHAVLEEKGFNPPWTIHNEYDEARGIKATTGSLGLGLPTAVGRALAKQINGDDGIVYCMIGDGEMQEGVIWESLNIAKRFNLTNLVTLVDNNSYQAVSSIGDVMEEDTNTIARKLQAFGQTVHYVYGHSNEGLSRLLTLPVAHLNSVIIDTQKGKGIPFLERNPSHHVLYMHERPEVFEEAMEYLRE